MPRDLPRRAVAEALVLALVIVEAEPGADAGLGLGDRRIGVEVDFLVFEAAPQPLDEDVVHAAAPRFREGRLLPSMLIVMARASSTPVNSLLVNWHPWSVLKISGVPYRASASSRASDPLAVDSVPLPRQPRRHPAQAVIGSGQVLPIDQRHDRAVLLADLGWPAVHRSAGYCQQTALL
jgi:hypothetical protein